MTEILVNTLFILAIITLIFMLISQVLNAVVKVNQLLRAEKLLREFK